MRAGLIAVALACVAASAALANTTYVYCIEDRIEVDMRSPQQMQSDRIHAKICMIGPTFDFGPDATRWVETTLHQRPGGRCSCR